LDEKPGRKKQQGEFRRFQFLPSQIKLILIFYSILFEKQWQ